MIEIKGVLGSGVQEGYIKYKSLEPEGSLRGFASDLLNAFFGGSFTAVQYSIWRSLKPLVRKLYGLGLRVEVNESDYRLPRPKLAPQHPHRAFRGLIRYRVSQGFMSV